MAWYRATSPNPVKTREFRHTLKNYGVRTVIAGRLVTIYRTEIGHDHRMQSAGANYKTKVEELVDFDPIGLWMAICGQECVDQEVGHRHEGQCNSCKRLRSNQQEVQAMARPKSDGHAGVYFHRDQGAVEGDHEGERRIQVPDPSPNGHTPAPSIVDQLRTLETQAMEIAERIGDAIQAVEKVETYRTEMARIQSEYEAAMAEIRKGV